MTPDVPDSEGTDRLSRGRRFSPESLDPPTLTLIESGSRWIKAWRFFLAYPSTTESLTGRTSDHGIRLQSLSPERESESGAAMDSDHLESSLGDLLRGKPRVAIFWEISADVLLARTAMITTIRRQYPDCLQLAGTGALSPLDSAAISELGITAAARGPEDLPPVASMLQRFMRAQ